MSKSIEMNSQRINIGQGGPNASEPNEPSALETEENIIPSNRKSGVAINDDANPEANENDQGDQSPETSSKVKLPILEVGQQDIQQAKDYEKLLHNKNLNQQERIALQEKVTYLELINHI